MVKERPQPRVQPTVIQEQISTRTIEALMANYRDAQQAFLDLVDNAIDNRIEDKPLTIRIRTSKDELSISNHGGEGLDLTGLRNYFTWGHSDKTIGKIGQFGVGGKAAMGFLGRGMEIVCSPNGSNKEYKISDPSWETREGELKQYVPEEKPATTQDGYFRVRITETKREINPQALVIKLGDIYRPLLLDGAVRITVNGREVTPLDIKYLESDPNLAPQSLLVQTRLGEKFIVKVGILPEDQRTKAGIRCYYRGRLIEDEQFFGHPGPAQMAGSSRLIGEAHLDFVPVTPNKATFIKSSVEWDNASKQMHKILQPWIEKAEKLRGGEKTPVERYEKDIARRAKRVFEHALATTNLITKANVRGEAFGRLSATPLETPRPKPVRTHRPPKVIEGETAPKITAVVGETVKRWGPVHEVDVVSMGNEQARAEIVEENQRRILKINSDYPLYQVAKRLGEDAQEVYMTETMALASCREVTKDKSIDEYADLVNLVLSECGRILRNRIPDRRTKHNA